MSHRLPLADIQFISDFAAFCRTKGDERYYFTAPSRCAVAQFGFPALYMSGCDDDGVQRVPSSVMEAASFQTWTFSALATRLEALLTDAPVVVSQP